MNKIFKIFIIVFFAINFLHGETELLLTEPVKTNKKGYTDYEKWHEYSGYVTLALLGATMLTKFDRDMHEGFGTATAVSMIGTSSIGLIAHKNDIFDLSKGFKAKHWHSILGALATVAMVATLASAPDDQHAAFGVAGGVMATASFILVKW